MIALVRGQDEVSLLLVLQLYKEDKNRMSEVTHLVKWASAPTTKVADTFWKRERREQRERVSGIQPPRETNLRSSSIPS